VAAAAELFTGERAGLQPLADALVNQRLLTRSQVARDVPGAAPASSYEVAHEALLRVPPLGDLIFARREKFEQVRILEVETRQYTEDGHVVRFGERLKDARTLLEDPDLGPDLKTKNHGGSKGNPLTVEAYLNDCREYEVRMERRNQRRVIGGLSTLTLLAVAFSVVALFALENALQARDDARRVEGLQALDTGRKADHVYPDRIFYRAKAIGFSGFDGREARDYRPRKFLAPLFWREAWNLLRDHRAEHPILVPEKLEQARFDLENEPAFLPSWRSAPTGRPVSVLDVEGTRLFAAYADGGLQQWGLKWDGWEPLPWPNAPSQIKRWESSGVVMKGTTVEFHAFGSTHVFTSHPSLGVVHRIGDTLCRIGKRVGGGLGSESRGRRNSQSAGLPRSGLAGL